MDRRFSWRFWLVVGGLALAGLVASTTPALLSLSRWEVPGSESYAVGRALAEAGLSPPTLVLLVTTSSVDAVAAEGRALTQRLSATPGIAAATSYWSEEGAGAAVLRSRDGTQALVLASLSGTVTQARRALETIVPAFEGDYGAYSVAVGGQDEVFRETASLARRDFVWAELVILPASFLVLWGLFRRWRVALVTLGVGVGALVLTLAALRVVVAFTEVSTFALNLALVMSLGLGLDYMLFLILRYREERRTKESDEALRTTWATAGHTVLMSGLTVALGCAVLWVFPFPFLQSFATTGVLVVASALALALGLGRPLVARLDNHLLVPETGHREFPWRRVVASVFRRPLIWGVPALVVVVALASPIVGLRLGTPDHRVLPPGSPARILEEAKNAAFDAEATDALYVQGVGGTGPATSWADRVGALPSVAAVEPAGEFWRVVPRTNLDAGAVEALVEALRADEGVAVGGYPADLLDFRMALLERLPWALGLLLLVTLGLLLWQTGSVVLALKAVVLNLLSLGVLFGVLVWVFQEGHLATVLGFTALGTLEPSIPILMFCVAFGLSMDYEVLLLSRIQEAYHRSGRLEEAVAEGLAQTGPVVTRAAFILAGTFAVYLGGSVVFLKMLGLAMPLVILVDATLIRLVLVPVFFRLAGRANWWAPRWWKALRRALSPGSPREG